jgi:outer membrane protein assembly factor BamB
MDANPKPSLRLWPAALILVFSAVALSIIWYVAPTHQSRNIATFILLLITAGLLLLWFLLASRASAIWRAVTFLTLLACAFVSRRLFEIRGVSGDLVPIIALRSTPKYSAKIPQPEATPRVSPTNSLVAGEFPQFQGPLRNGVITSVQLETNWSLNPPAIVWRKEVGPAWSGFAISSGRAVTQEQRQDLECVVCYNLLTGEILWSRSDNGHYSTVIAGEGPRATPTISNNRVYTLGATGLLTCLDLLSGNLIWQKDVLKENHAPVPEWGLAGSPLVINDKVVVSVGAKDNHSLIAYNVSTGELLWASGQSSAEYSSPTLLNFLGQPQIVIFNSSIVSHQPENGSILWKYPWPGGHPHIALPVAVSSNLLLVSSGYGTGSELIQLDKVSPTNWTTSRVWKSMALKSKFAPILVYHDFIYGLDDGIFTCVELKTGQRKWKDGRYGHGQALLVNDFILLTAEKGDLVLIQPNPEKLLEISTLHVFSEKSWNPPALAGQYLLMRNDHQAACLKLPALPATQKNIALLFAKQIFGN